MSTLLDANVLIALVMEAHVHHEATEDWMIVENPEFATCPMTQGTLLRTLLREGDRTKDALGTLADLEANPKHRFWTDALSFREVHMHGVLGHKQVTDAYLAGLARAYRGQIVTFDRGLAALHPDVAVLLQTKPQLPEQRNGE